MGTQSAFRGLAYIITEGYQMNRSYRPRIQKEIPGKNLQ